MGGERFWVPRWWLKMPPDPPQAQEGGGTAGQGGGSRPSSRGPSSKGSPPPGERRGGGSRRGSVRGSVLGGADPAKLAGPVREGDHVLARAGGESRWLKAQVLGLNEDGTLDLRYSDTGKVRGD